MNTDLHFREAKREDLPDIVRLLSEDSLGSQRETNFSPLPQSYYAAFDTIAHDPNNELVVVESSGEVIGTLQLTFIPYVTYRGSWRALVEGVRVDRRFRSRGIGEKLISWAIERSKQRGCRMVQLTSNKKRAAAIRFYKKLGFVPSHEGLKLLIRSDEATEPNQSSQTGSTSGPA